MLNNVGTSLCRNNGLSHGVYGGLILNSIRTLALGTSVILATISIFMIAISGGITTEVWALLLLVPISAGFALAGTDRGNNTDVDTSEYWEDSTHEQIDGSVGDPSEAGFDIPVL